MRWNQWLLKLWCLRTSMFKRRLVKSIKRRPVYLQCEALEERYALDDNSAGMNGIDARALNLTGNNVRIGQVEQGRPGMSMRNGVAFDNKFNRDVNPTDVFLRDGAPIANQDLDPHATWVAGVMIANGGANRGIAPNASLYASAYRTGGNGAGAYENALLSMQQIPSATANGVRAINMSWVKSPRRGVQLDGNSLLSQGLDYLAHEHDTLYVVSPANRGGAQQIPADAFNDLGVSAAKRVGGNGMYRQVMTPPPLGANNRRLVDLIAPGENISVPNPVVGGNGAYIPKSGSSLVVQRGFPDP